MRYYAEITYHNGFYQGRQVSAHELQSKPRSENVVALIQMDENFDAYVYLNFGGATSIPSNIESVSLISDLFAIKVLIQET